MPATPGLHSSEARLSYAPCRGDNVLYRRGFLKVSQNGRYLTHGDGSPFLWIRHEPHKPVINLEAMYDGQGENGWQAVDARSLAWRSWLSGAKGYTYGAGDTPPKCPQGSGGVWKWVTDRDKPDFWEKAIGGKAPSRCNTCTTSWPRSSGGSWSRLTNSSAISRTK